MQNRLPAFWRRVKEHPLAKLGPGLVTGVADDDPSGIVTYSQAGAQFGFNMLWTLPLTFPLMVGIQTICARIGRVTGKGLAANIKAHFPPVILWVVVLLLVIANTLNIAADVAAMGEVAELVLGFNRHVMAICFVVLTLVLQIFIPYHRYVVYLKWLTLSLLSYALILFVVHIDWAEAFRTTLFPSFAWNANSAAIIVGVFGTTISPYLFFWQASEEVEDLNRQGARSLLEDGRPAKLELQRISWDTWSGMLYSNISAYFIVLATGATLFVAGVHDIETAAQAAMALRPLAGDFAFELFAIGMLGVGLIGIPVLAGSAAYALSEMMGWSWGLEKKWREAPEFYLTITLCVGVAIFLQYVSISPMKALVWSAVTNGVIAVPLMLVIMLLSANKAVMGEFALPTHINILGWLATLLMLLAVMVMFIFI
jgi:NRAMP (natural resistance-associated macrophage protein)-like metal ion transporter